MLCDICGNVIVPRERGADRSVRVEPATVFVDLCSDDCAARCRAEQSESQLAREGDGEAQGVSRSDAITGLPPRGHHERDAVRRGCGQAREYELSSARLP